MLRVYNFQVARQFLLITTLKLARRNNYEFFHNNNFKNYDNSKNVNTLTYIRKNLSCCGVRINDKVLKA